jgi:hypothetical protein
MFSNTYQMIARGAEFSCCALRARKLRRSMALKKPVFALLFLLLPAGLWAKNAAEPPQPVSAANGSPGLRFPGVATLDRKRFVVVEHGGAAADPALVFHLTHQSSLHFCSGLLIVSAQRVSWKAGCHTEPFDVARPEVQIKESTIGTIYGGFAHVDAFGHHYDFTGTSDQEDQRVWSESLNQFLIEAIQDFPAAEKEFWQLRGEEPPLPPPPPDDGFHAAAEAWRALAVKPELPEDARKQRVLAEAYLREKDFKGAIEHYEAGVKACPVWPEGWYNLALLYAESGQYALAADRMKHYLELMPNASDSAAARDKVIVWEDKASRQ